MINISSLMAYEDGSLDEDAIIDMFQEMINDGSVWSLQGSYGQIAIDLIRQGICEVPVERIIP